jgi:hypothetical protein
MLGVTSNSGIRDNHRRGLVADFLKAKIRGGSRLSVVSAYFTIYAYDLLREHLDQIDHLDFLFGEPRFIASLDPAKTDKKSFKIEDEGLELANRLEQKRVARDCAEWIRQKVNIRSIRQAQLLHGKMYHMKRYSKLLAATVDSIARTFQKRVAAGLQSGRGFVIPDQQEQARQTTEFDLITWLVIKAP